jgi:hypothetical protein
LNRTWLLSDSQLNNATVKAIRHKLTAWSADGKLKAAFDFHCPGRDDGGGRGTRCSFWTLNCNSETKNKVAALVNDIIAVKQSIISPVNNPTDISSRQGVFPQFAEGLPGVDPTCCIEMHENDLTIDVLHEYGRDILAGLRKYLVEEYGEPETPVYNCPPLASRHLSRAGADVTIYSIRGRKIATMHGARAEHELRGLPTTLCILRSGGSGARLRFGPTR